MQTERSNSQLAVFLDRDGVLIENIDDDYVRTIDQIKVLPGAKDAVRRLFQADFLPVVVTNQAAVAKGFISLSEAWSIQRTVESIVASGRKMASTLCPHDKTDNCNCRKPRPGMLLEMARKYQIDLNHSFLIGDAMTDIAAARTAGVTPLLVMSGRGAQQYRQATKQELKGIEVFSSIIEATDYIIRFGQNNKLQTM